MATRQSKTMAAAHTAGIFADMRLDGPEIGTLVAVVDRAKNLPNRKTMGKQDPYCAMRLGKEAKKTETDRRGGQTPRWDQELRFTVHESPDYYKLKCSVFNDDKKTDIIGEAWIDLHEVIVPGGGQNDLWHHLNFKGKYAGDIRVELTYYDTRPEPKVISEKRKPREKNSFSAEDGAGAMSEPRQLGPREIKRRPLPPNPECESPINVNQLQLRQQQQQLFSTDSSHAYRGQGHALGPEPSFTQNTTELDFVNQPDHQNSDPSYYMPQEQTGHGQYYESEEFLPVDQQPLDTRTISPYGYQNYPESPGDYDLLTTTQSPYPDEREVWNNPSSPISPLTTPQHTIAPRQASPPSRPNSQSSLSGIQQQSFPKRNSVSPTKHGVYRDSPLRQSMNQAEQLDAEFMSQEVGSDDNLPPPPPPPVHRDSLPRDINSYTYQGSDHSQPPQKSPFSRSSIDRSPLQMLEQNYSSPQLPVLAEARSGKLQQAYSPPVPHRNDRRRSQDDRTSSDLEDMLPPPHRISYNHDALFNGQPIETNSNIANVNRSRRPSKPRDTTFGPPRRAHTFDPSQVYEEHLTYRSEPQMIRPRAVSPNPNFATPRKSISPHTLPVVDDHRMSGIPFSPDSYDVLNPGSSPATNGSTSYTTPEHGKEAARQKEVDRLREQGPIIGNDGRVIDPSDHLPSDTWAPEPERKVRKPEHVIRFRTKEEIRSHVRQGSSPTPVRPMSMHSTPYQASPETGFAASAPNSSGGRNRLQKQMPERPLPAHPFLHTQTSPAVLTTSAQSSHDWESPRNSVHSSPASGFVQRPAMDDRGSLPMNNYIPSGFVPRQQPLTPSRISSKDRHIPVNSPYGYDDALVAEMSTIDIGPSRGGRTALRSNRGY